jgi:hypothetical protein
MRSIGSRSRRPGLRSLRAFRTTWRDSSCSRIGTRPPSSASSDFLDLHTLDRSYLEEYVSNVYAVTPEDVSRIARDYLDDSKMIIAIAGAGR